MTSPQRHTQNASKHKDKERVNDAMLLVEIPPIPNVLGEIGAFWWEYYCGLMIESGILSRMYLNSLTHLCFLVEIVEILMNEIKTEGVVIPVPKLFQGEEYVDYIDNPRIPKLTKVMRDLTSLAGQFGFTPFSAKVNNLDVGGDVSNMIAAPPTPDLSPPEST